eukprot:1395460-Amorphochlora_amoeboformis.AAC.3
MKAIGQPSAKKKASIENCKQISRNEHGVKPATTRQRKHPNKINELETVYYEDIFSRWLRTVKVALCALGSPSNRGDSGPTRVANMGSD